MSKPKIPFMLRMINFWPPLVGTGIRVKRMDPDFRAIDVEMKLRFWNRNYVKTQFGGALYAMTDPFYMVMLIQNLGRDYIVWDKAATIRFLKPGVRTVRAEFRLPPERVAEIRAAADREYKVEPTFTVQIIDTEGVVVAEVDKLLYVRRKDKSRPK